MKKHIVHLLSGGLDSVVMLYDLVGQKCNVHCVLFDYQQRHAQELIWARLHCHRLNILFTTVTLPQLRGSELTDGSGGAIVPNRNATLLSIAVNIAVAAGAETVTFAANKDDAEDFPDCRKAFIRSYNEMLCAAQIKVEVCAPYLNKPKSWIAALGSEMGVRFSETWSCYRGGSNPCGVCGACLKRNAAIGK
jgi:7-cyano-7-deazaguanine synthase